jgi:hypothetical protein
LSNIGEAGVILQFGFGLKNKRIWKTEETLTKSEVTSSLTLKMLNLEDMFNILPSNVTAKTIALGHEIYDSTTGETIESGLTKMGEFKKQLITAADAMLESGHEMTEEEFMLDGGCMEYGKTAADCCGGGCHAEQQDEEMELLDGRQVDLLVEKAVMKDLAKEIFETNVSKGFWDECKVECAYVDEIGQTVTIPDFVPSKRNFGEFIALVHSELSEALEAHRKDLMDDKLPQYKGVDVELADAMIRILDWVGANDIPIMEILRAKLEYNKSRPFKHGKKY